MHNQQLGEIERESTFSGRYIQRSKQFTICNRSRPQVPVYGQELNEMEGKVHGKAEMSSRMQSQRPLGTYLCLANS